MGNCCSPGCRLYVYDDVFLCCPFSPRDVLDEMVNLLESVSEVFSTYSCQWFSNNKANKEIITELSVISSNTKKSHQLSFACKYRNILR